MAGDEKLDLDALAELERKATEGPWEHDDVDHRQVFAGSVMICCVDDLYGSTTEENANFIVAMRLHARTLISEARRARALVALAQYACHRANCIYYGPHPVVIIERPCSCGLSALLRREDERG